MAWTSLINAYAQSGHFREALEALKIMAGSRCCADPDARCFLAAVKAIIAMAAVEWQVEIPCRDGKIMVVKMEALRQGMEIHALARKRGLDQEQFLGSAIVDMYAKCGSLVDARAAFDRMPTHDAVILSSIASACVSHGDSGVALELLSSSSATLPLDAWAISAALKACSTTASSPPLVQSLHTRILRSGMESIAVLHAGLIDAYCKSGSLVHAHHLFAASAAENDSIAWNALLAGLSHRGDTHRALELFHQMVDEGIPAVGASFVSVISACSHTGMVDNANKKCLFV